MPSFKFKLPSMRYFRPTSLTWWTGVVAIILGILPLTGIENDFVDTFSKVLVALTGGADSSSAGLILGGLGLIGIHDKIHRALG